ncbi:MAG: glyceraldehyde-3-phosphate dehydrogenase [Pseudomonadota bacterium]
MTNRLAIILGALIVLSLIADRIFNDGAATVFLVKQLLELIEWIAFWR